MSVTPNPWVFMDFTVDGEAAGRVVFELRTDIAPVACENFRSLCTGWKGLGRFDKPLHYKGNRVHRCIPDRLVMAGDIITQDGTSGESIYGDTFEDENFVLRHAGPGTLSTCNRGPDTNDSRFFISLGMADFLDDKSVVFGYVMTGMDVIRDIERLGTPNTGEMRKEVVIADCGECTPQVGSESFKAVWENGSASH
jgi:peptidylprolyl isomerase